MYPFLLRGHQRPINVVKLNYDGDLLFTGDAGSVINVWESHTGERLGSYATQSSVKSLDIDINSKYVIYVSFAGTLQMLQVQTGNVAKWTRFPSKLKQVQFDLGSKRFLVLQDAFEINKPTTVKVFDFKQFLDLHVNDPKEMISEGGMIKPKLEFNTTLENGSIRLATKVMWYVDNETFFVSTEKGEIVQYDLKGKIKKSEVIHRDSIINSFTFSKDYSVLATAAGDGCKIIDPETFQVLRYFKQELPMNCVSLSPLFCSESTPKYHIIMGGGIPAMQTAMTRGKAGYQALVCNVMYGTQVGKISGHFGPINTIQFFKDGKGYISAGEDTVIRVVRFDESYFDNPLLE